MASSITPPTYTLDNVSSRTNLAQQEETILKLWSDIDAFQTQLKRSEGMPEYMFYDGPPFATGLPHYGHLLAGFIKDTVTRFATQTGHHVTRRFGWDTHGLPVEYEIDKKLDLHTKEDVLAFGIDKYNAECRSIVMRYSSDWERIVTRCGRWIDFQDDYKTLDISYMESVWWVFSELFKKGLVRRDFNVMPYSARLGTPLSNFEANLNYQTVRDPAVTVRFRVVGEDNTSFLAWTTTPWTLPANFALAVHPHLEDGYVLIEDTQRKERFYLAKARLVEMYGKKAVAAALAPAAGAAAADASGGGKKGKKGKGKKGKGKDAGGKPKEVAFTILKELQGVDLAGKAYEPLFDYFAEEGRAAGAFRVLLGDYVDDKSGTGIVHQAPGFGADDFAVCKANGIAQQLPEGVMCPIDANGRYLEALAELKGVFVKDADDQIVDKLRAKGLLIKREEYEHSYPFCWRSETPLIYRAVPAWFIAVTELKEKLLANNEKTHWVPDFVKSRRFHNWLEGAHDWNVSRNRYWGTPLPIWVSDDHEEVRVIGSVEELEKAAGLAPGTVTDLHRDSIDHYEIPSTQGKGTLKRVEHVFDCWFESGSMPYAQQHYPFENKEKFENSLFPADFIAEGLDQTRGWFYTLMVLSTALFDKPAFEHVIVNGLVLAEDGKKMSKRLQNYPDPMKVVSAYGSDALRMYLLNSPVVRAEPLRFKEAGVRDVVRDVFLPWLNVYRFLVENTRRMENDSAKAGAPVTFVADPDVWQKTTNVMDRWIISAFQTLVGHVREEMGSYTLFTVMPKLVSFIHQLTNWYVKLNRGRMRGQEGHDEAVMSLQVLYSILFHMSRVMSPFSPFFVEAVYQNLRTALPEGHKLRQDSVHYLSIPDVLETAVDPVVEEAVFVMQDAVTLGRVSRESRLLSQRQPLLSATLVHQDAAVLRALTELGLTNYICDQLNVKEVKVSSEPAEWITLKASPHHGSLGKRLRKQKGAVVKALMALDQAQLLEFTQTGSVDVAGATVTADECSVAWEFRGDEAKYASASSPKLVVFLDIAIGDELRREFWAREFVNRVQKQRKELGLVPTDTVDVFFSTPSAELAEAVEEHREFITQATRVKSVFSVRVGSSTPGKAGADLVVDTSETEINGEKMTLRIVRQKKSASAAQQEEAF